MHTIQPSDRPNAASVVENVWRKVPDLLRILTLATTITIAYLGPSIASPAMQPISVLPSSDRFANAVGEIKRIDLDRGVITLKHGPIEAMGMPDMTMAFPLVNLEQINTLRVGDAVAFKVAKIRGTLVVVDLHQLSSIGR